ncbi:MAG: hypothetical protein ABI633_05085 [Burkholderiales bacterium]
MNDHLIEVLRLQKRAALSSLSSRSESGAALDRCTPNHALMAAIASGTEPAKINTRSPGMGIHSSVRAVVVPVYSRLRACQYRRGEMEELDRAGLEAASCGCYAADQGTHVDAMT